MHGWCGDSNTWQLWAGLLGEVWSSLLGGAESSTHPQVAQPRSASPGPLLKEAESPQPPEEQEEPPPPSRIEARLAGVAAFHRAWRSRQRMHPSTRTTRRTPS